MPRTPSDGEPDPAARSADEGPTGHLISDADDRADLRRDAPATLSPGASAERIVRLLREAEWQIVADRPRPPPENLAIDEALLEAVRAGRRGPTLRLWEWTSPAVVLGRFQSVADEVDLEAARDRGAEVVRRVSGGGAMWIRPGESVTWSLYLPERLLGGAGIRDSYEPLDRWAVETLRGLGAYAWYRPLNDIAGPLGKIAGSAQARRPGAILHHTTAAFVMDDGEMRRILRLGRERTAPRGTRSADRVVDPLARQLSLSYPELLAALQEAFAARFRSVAAAVEPAEEQDAARLLRERYARRDWLEIVP